ncbi:urate hydroxylase PuuD [Mesorhizobium sp.]|uniref:urate hydroxylase PuuD n=1 Tax=Mesorhizobium sp. TaxID=1871066 RepID=UPI000FE532D9|nr:urate hydroxylase PuuD [Mesorhizobium sp.]RWP07024.1 MAG: cysteine desulfurase [Mesorhizobium sp.]
MMDFAIFWDWLSFAVRWLHVITGIAWIGSSFYFVALDLGLRQRPGMPVGAFGEEWQVHGGGFYHIQKYLVAPAEMPEHLTWFKWESYATWLSGFAMLCVVYYAGADLFLIDPNVLPMSAPTGILLSLATIGVGWVVYDLLCRSPLGKSDTGLMLVLYCVLVFIAWGLTHLFTGRAAFLHLGAITATIMSANERSLHNNYLTLPVLFLMLSNHYPLAFGTEFNWIIASLVFIIGVLIRHYFNSVHARKGNPTWTWMAALVLFIVIIWLSTAPKVLTGEPKESAAAQIYVASVHFPAVRDTVLGRCSMCHAAEPVYEGIYHAPKGVMLDTDADIANHAREIYLQAGRSHAMPPANVSQITDKERALLVAWFEGAGR